MPSVRLITPDEGEREAANGNPWRHRHMRKAWRPCRPGPWTLLNGTGPGRGAWERGGLEATSTLYLYGLLPCFAAILLLLYLVQKHLGVQFPNLPGPEPGRRHALFLLFFWCGWILSRGAIDCRVLPLCMSTYSTY